jgi:alanine dehydrogenase
VRALANKGVLRALREDPSLARGVNVWHGQLTSLPVAESLRLEYSGLAEVMTA